MVHINIICWLWQGRKITENLSCREMGKTLVNNFYLDGVTVILQIVFLALPEKMDKILQRISSYLPLIFHSKFSPKVETEFWSTATIYLPLSWLYTGFYKVSYCLKIKYKSWSSEYQDFFFFFTWTKQPLQKKTNKFSMKSCIPRLSKTGKDGLVKVKPKGHVQHNTTKFLSYNKCINIVTSTQICSNTKRKQFQCNLKTQRAPDKMILIFKAKILKWLFKTHTHTHTI